MKFVTFVLIATPDVPLWEHRLWTDTSRRLDELFRGMNVQVLLEDQRGKASKRSQFQWQSGATLPWTNAPALLSRFVSMEVWNPPRGVCEKTGEPPRAFLQVRHSPLTDNQSIVAAVRQDSQVEAEIMNDFMKAATETQRRAILLVAEREWLQDFCRIQDLMAVGDVLSLILDPPQLPVGWSVVAEVGDYLKFGLAEG